jgi:hypothetical protein
MNNNYKIIRTIFENVFQRVLECKDNDSGDIFYSNIITSQKVINLINLDELKKISSNILECYNTEDRIYIYTKPLKSDYKGLRENISNSLTLKQQFKLSESVIDLAQNVFNMTDVVQQKILDIDRLYFDGDNKVIVDCNLIFEQEYDIADNETFKRLGNMIHFIFSGTEIIDYNISDLIPPDILKLIVRCLTREYIFPNDVLEEMKNSPIYGMIFDVVSTERVKQGDKTTERKIQEHHNEQTETKEIFNEAAVDIHPDDDSPVFDIFVNDNNPIKSSQLKSFFKKKEITRAVVSILIVVIVLLIGNKIINKFGSKPADSNNIQNNPQNENPEQLPNSENPTGEAEAPQSEITDSTEMYFNDALLNNIGYTGNKATTDNNIYVEGKNSLIVANDSDGTYKALFAAVDFKNEKFSYMLKKQIGIAAKMKSEKDLMAQIVLEAFKNGSLTSNFHTSVQIYDDMWSQFTVPINVTDADSLNIYIQYEGKNKVWIDSIFIDEIK